MLRSLAVPLIVIAAVFSSFSAGSAAASGVPLKGKLLVAHHQKYHSFTGQCSCEWTWSTVGLNPGKATFAANVQLPMTTQAPKYTIEMYVFKGNAVAGHAKVLCGSSGMSPCNKTVKVHITVKHAGVYYVEMRGKNASHVWYNLTVSGKVQTLHCRKKVC